MQHEPSRVPAPIALSAMYQFSFLLIVQSPLRRQHWHWSFTLVWRWSFTLVTVVQLSSSSDKLEETCFITPTPNCWRTFSWASSLLSYWLRNMYPNVTKDILLRHLYRCCQGVYCVCVGTFASGYYQDSLYMRVSLDYNKHRAYFWWL